MTRLKQTNKWQSVTPKSGCNGEHPDRVRPAHPVSILSHSEEWL
jgi:hypothetical protein